MCHCLRFITQTYLAYSCRVLYLSNLSCYHRFCSFLQRRFSRSVFTRWNGAIRDWLRRWRCDARSCCAMESERLSGGRTAACGWCCESIFEIRKLCVTRWVLSAICVQTCCMLYLDMLWNLYVLLHTNKMTSLVLIFIKKRASRDIMEGMLGMRDGLNNMHRVQNPTTQTSGFILRPPKM